VYVSCGVMRELRGGVVTAGFHDISILEARDCVFVAKCCVKESYS
jgi:hypothetical protein